MVVGTACNPCTLEVKARVLGDRGHLWLHSKFRPAGLQEALSQKTKTHKEIKIQNSFRGILLH